MSVNYYDKDSEQLTKLAGSSALVMDSTPSSGSTNPVTSNGIYEALATKMTYTDNGVLGAKNLIRDIVGHASSYVSRNITYTTYDDGSVHMGEGTADSELDSVYIFCNASKYVLSKGTYILSGCPQGGNGSTYCLYIHFRNADDTGWGLAYIDTGNGVKFTISDENIKLYLAIRLKNGKTSPAGGLLFKPMIRLASDPDDTYAPYAMTNKQLTDEVAPLACTLTTAGTYTLSATVDSDGNVTYTWA